jgi:uncharacterized protein YneF (UPF0154 family)
VKREVRFLVITTVIVAAAVIGFYLVAKSLRSNLGERPYAAAIKQQLRLLAAGQEIHHSASGTYAAEVVRVWAPPADGSAQGIRLHIVAADSRGYIAEGRSIAWDGRCVLALGHFAGDSLLPGEVVCQGD